MNNYTLTWSDNTLVENYPDPRELVENHAGMGIQLENLYVAPDNWYEYVCVHCFSAEDDDKAKEYVKQYNFGHRDVEVFTLTRVDTYGKEEFYWTEENWNDEEVAKNMEEN